MRLRSGQGRIIELLLSVIIIFTFVVSAYTLQATVRVSPQVQRRPPIDARAILEDLAVKGVLDDAVQSDNPPEYVAKALRAVIPPTYNANVTFYHYQYDEDLHEYVLVSEPQTACVYYGLTGTLPEGVTDEGEYILIDRFDPNNLGVYAYVFKLVIYRVR